MSREIAKAEAKRGSSNRGAQRQKGWPDYRQRLILAVAAFKPGTIYDVQVMHDHWCGIYRRQDCDCRSDIVVRQIVDGTISAVGKFAILQDGTVRELA